MKGLIFNSLAELVETQHDLATWNRVLGRIDSVVDGAYVSTDSYPASEMQALVMALTEELETPAAELLNHFGSWLFHDLYRAYPELVDGHTDLVPFIASVSDVIHEEMKIIYADAEVPTMSYTTQDRHNLTFYYQSPRQLCLLAEGLVRGAAAHFAVEADLEHQTCMHDGADRCTFLLRVRA